MQRLPSKKNIRKHTTNIRTQSNTTPTPIPTRLQEKNRMAPNIELEINASSAQALEIPNPNKSKRIKVNCITEDKVKQTLSDLQIETIQAITNNENEIDQITKIHQAFVKAAKKLEITGKQNGLN